MVQFWNNLRHRVFSKKPFNHIFCLFWLVESDTQPIRSLPIFKKPKGELHFFLRYQSIMSRSNWHGKISLHKCNRSLSHNFIFFCNFFFTEWKISSNSQQNARVQNRGTRFGWRRKISPDSSICPRNIRGKIRSNNRRFISETSRSRRATMYAWNFRYSWNGKLLITK